MKGNRTQPPSGTRDYLPEEVRYREKIFNGIKQVFEKYGFLPMETPAFERIENLLDKYGSEGDKLIFKILKRGAKNKNCEADLALRYDLTVPLARFFTQYQNQLPLPFRRYQIGTVWRADRPGRGRFREFYQCDIDTVGSESLLADAEIILVLTEVLNSIGDFEYVIKVNSRKVLHGLLEVYNIPNRKEKDVLIVIDKLDKIGADGVVRELKELGFSNVLIERIQRDLKKTGDELRRIIGESMIGKEGLKEVDTIISLIKPLLVKGKIEFSPFLARGLDYYTGPIFEIFVRGIPGAVASGGRYDNLMEMFSEKQVPACGGSIGIDRLLSYVDLKKVSGVLNPQVFIPLWEESLALEVFGIASELRRENIITEISLDDRKIGKQIRLASKRKATYVVLYGPDERERQEVVIKNLVTGEQKSVNRNQLVRTLKNLLEN